MLQDFAEQQLLSSCQHGLIVNCPTVNFVFNSYLSNYFINREMVTRAGLYEDFISQKMGLPHGKQCFTLPC